MEDRQVGLTGWQIGPLDEPGLIQLGRRLGEVWANGALPMQVALVGDLGAGKTTFSVAVGDSLGLDEPLTSPTFALMVEHEGDFRVLHADLYRLGIGELEGIGFQERVDSWDGLVLVEWPDRFPGCLQADHLEIRLVSVADFRELRVFAHGKRSEALLLAWKATSEAQ